MPEYKCEQCGKTFTTEDAFNQHKLAKHPPVEKKKLNMRRYVPIVIVALIIITGAYMLTSKPEYDIKLPDAPHVKGSGQIEIIEFSDFQCPACGAAYPEIKRFAEEYGNKTRFVYKHFPLPSHSFAKKAAEASECAADQNKFWEYHDKLFENQNTLDMGSLKRYAKELRLDGKGFDACLDSGVMESRVSSGYSEGQRLGVRATPSFFINNKKYEGVQRFDKLKTITGV